MIQFNKTSINNIVLHDISITDIFLIYYGLIYWVNYCGLNYFFNDFKSYFFMKSKICNIFA